MKRFKAFFWPAVGILAAAASLYLLITDKSMSTLSMSELWRDLRGISPLDYLGAVISTIVAYSALAWYDRIALLHLGHRLSWVFISLVSFTTYALSHNIGASVFSGAVVRYRAYSTKGLSATEVGVLVAFCSFTFFLGMISLGGIVLVWEPQIVERLTDPSAHLLPFRIPMATARLIGFGMLAFVALYVGGSILGLKPLKIRTFELAYPRLAIVARQLAAGPLELLGCAGIIYFALPSENNPGFFVVLGIFLVSFAVGLLSNAPGALGVLELVFVRAMPHIPQPRVVAALIVWRLLYLIIPLIFALVVAAIFERGRLSQAIRDARAAKESAP